MTDTNAPQTTDNPAAGQPAATAPQTTTTPAAGDNPLANFASNQTPADNPLNNAANPPAAGETTDPLSWLPEKFRTKAADGTALDYEASAKKLAESYAHLEKRNGAGELAPADITGYKITAEGLPPLEELNKYPDFQEFLGKAHAAGVNNAQLNLMVSELVTQAALNKPEDTRLTGAQAEAELRKVWTAPDVYNANMAAAVAAVRAVFKDPAEQQAVFNAYGTDPKILRMMATLGKEVGEDRLTLVGQPEITENDVEALMRDPAYKNEKDPKHAEIRQKVRTHFERSAGTGRVV